MLNVLITGANSYVGRSFAEWALRRYPEQFRVESISVRGDAWRERSFAGFDVVLHVASLVHLDESHMTEEEKQTYFAVNRDLSLAVAMKAKKEGVRQFIFMSTMSVYGMIGKYGQRTVITRETSPQPINYYGRSKWEADEGVRRMSDEGFKVAVVRPPMIYGPGCKGNYQRLAWLAKKLPVFPDVKNERSMLFIDNLSEFLCRLMLSGKDGVYFPQNEEYVRTSEMVRVIAALHGHRIWVTSVLNWIVALASMVPGKIGMMANKAFGSLYYELNISDNDIIYRIVKYDVSITNSELEITR